MSRKVLLIDDDRLQFRVTQAHFERFQTDRYELTWAATYDEGLTRLLSGEFVACLLDYRLGENDGLQLIREAVERKYTAAAPPLRCSGRRPVMFCPHANRRTTLWVQESRSIGLIRGHPLNCNLSSVQIRFAQCHRPTPLGFAGCAPVTKLSP